MGCGASADKVESAVSLVPGIRPTVSAPSTSLPTCTNEPDLAGFSQIREEDVVTRRLSEDATYGLKDPGALSGFLLAANIRPVRAEYLWYLAKEGRVLPRRQEAEKETFPDRSGQQVSALVTVEEIVEWEEDEAIIISVSHAWESREHPDPCAHQLRTINDYTSLHFAAYGVPVWLFYDYVSLFQYKRLTAEQHRSFRRAMANMHILYCHECTETVRVETLTPQALWEERLDTELRIWHEPSSCMKSVPLRELQANGTPYLDRGWCRAELEWSSARSRTVQNLRIDLDQQGQAEHASSKMPTPPEHFKEHLHGLTFTHRADLESVLRLQRKVYHEKVVILEEAVFHDLQVAEFALLAEGFHHYERLRSLELLAFQCDVGAAEELGEAVAASTALKRLKIQRADSGSALIFAKALAEALKYNSSVKDLDLQHNGLCNEAAEALADALRFNRTITQISLANNGISTGAQALAAALAENDSVSHIDLGCNQLGDKEVEALAEALKSNRSVLRLGLGGNLITNAGVEALADALEVNRAVKEIDLQYNEDITASEAEVVSDALQVHQALRLIAQDYNLNRGLTQATAVAGYSEEMSSPPRHTPRLEAVARALQENRAVTSIQRGVQHIGTASQALAEALEVNVSVTSINLQEATIGDAGCKALADALKVNATVSSINLARNDIGDDGAKELAEALKINRSVTEISLTRNNIGDEGAQALAEAIAINSSIVKVDLSFNSRIGEVGAQALEEVRQANSSVVCW